MRLGLTLVTGAALAVAGCASREPSPRPPAARPVQRPPVVIRPLFPADYVAQAASIDLFVIRSAELAATRSRDQRLRSYVQTLVDNHRGTSAQLSFGGRRLNLTPPAVLRPQHQGMLDALSSEPNFDALYRRQLVTVHEQAVDLHANFAQRGESPTLRTVAANALPIEQRHLQQLRALR